MKRKKLLALLLASTLVMSNFTVVNAEEAVAVGKEDAEIETTVEETKKDVVNVEQVTEAAKAVEEETIAETEEMVHIPDERFQSTLINQGLVVDENGNVKESETWGKL